MLRYAIHSIHGVDQSVIVRISDLHLECQKLLLSDLGLPFVVRYFEVCATDPDVVGFYAITDGGDLVGYIVGTARADRLNTRLTKPLGWFILHVLRLLFERPLVLVQGAVSSFRLRQQAAAEENAIELVYITVSPLARHQGVGRALMMAFHEASRAAGHQRVVASQEIDNEASIRLFASVGYRVVYPYREGRYHRQRVEFPL